MLTQDYLNLRLIRLPAQEAWALDPDRLSFVFPKGATGQFVSGSEVQRLAPGDVLVVKPVAVGKVSVRAGGELVFWCFSVCLENLFPLFAGHELAQLEAVAESFKVAKLYPEAQPVALECHRLLREVPPQVDLGHRTQLLRIVATILSAEFNQAHQARAGFGNAEQHLIRVFESLSGDEILGLSVEALAARFGCSRRHLNRLFHQYFGFAVATLLRNPEAKIIHVAEGCGFNHLGLFNICFKRRFGVNPSQWRKANASSEAPPPDHTGANLICALRSSGQCPWMGAAGPFGPNGTSPAKPTKPSPPKPPRAPA